MKPTVWLRAPDLSRPALIGDYQKLDVWLRYNDVATWVLDLDVNTDPAQMILAGGTWGYGISVERNSTILSGPLTVPERIRDAESNRLLLAGVADTAHVKRRAAHPEPGSESPPYNTDAHDVRTAAAETVLHGYVNANLGPDAIARRRVAGLTMGTDNGAGTTITGRARWQNLLDLLRSLALAGGDLGFHIVQAGSGIEFQVYEPADLTDTAIFSEELGNLRGFTYRRTTPETNWVYVLGAGEGTGREVRERRDGTSIITHGLIESVRDRRDTGIDSELDQSGDEEIEKGAAKTGLSLNPKDTDRLAYGTHYGLGDRVTVDVDGVPITDVVRQVRLTWTPEAGEELTPTVGTPDGPTDELRIFRLHAEARRRLDHLEAT